MQKTLDSVETHKKMDTIEALNQAVLKKPEKKLQKKSKKAEFDSPWKRILDLYFQDFMALCWPEKYALIDWDKGYKMLDKELAKIDKDAAIGDREADKLVEIYCKHGGTHYLLLHLEVQRKASNDFAKRMFSYRYKLQDIYDKPIASLAILIDNDRSWRPGIYRQELWGSWVEMSFPIIKIMDYADRIVELQNSNNRFASVILAQLAANQKGSQEAKGMTKLALTKSLYHHGWVGDDIRDLYRFIDWLIRLPEDLEVTYNAAVQVFEESLKVDYITTAERIGIQKGLAQAREETKEYVTTAERIGIQKGESALLLEILKERFDNIPAHYQEKINQRSAADLLALARRAIRSQTLEDVFKGC